MFTLFLDHCRVSSANMQMFPLLVVAVVVVRASGKGFSGGYRYQFSPSSRKFHQHIKMHSSSTSTSCNNYAMETRSIDIYNLLSMPRGGGSGLSSIQTITSLSQIQTIINNALASNQLVVLDFASNNCPPCEMIAPIYDELSQLNEFSTVIFCKVNVSLHPEIAKEYGVDGWPTFLFFNKGIVVNSVVGGQAAKAGLHGWITRHLL